MFRAQTRITVFVVFLSAAAVACAADRPGSTIATTAVSGKVVLSPSRPACRVGQPCSKPLARFRLVFSRRGVVVARATTDRRGRYRVSLSAGSYAVTTPRRSLGRGLRPTRISIPAARQAIRNFTYDAGIR
jgi:hypothetical protein